MNRHLLLIEHSPSAVKDYLDSLLTGYLNVRCECASWNSLAVERLRNLKARLIIAVAVPMSSEAIRLFRWLLEHPMTTPMLAVLPNEVDTETLGAVSQLADDFILWPVHKEELRYRLNRILGPTIEKGELASAHEHLTELMAMQQLVGKHPEFILAIRPIPLIAKSNLPVLITGATGTGKELCARAIHLSGKRRNFPFIAVDCGAIPDHLFENELFGHARGAFTDAHSDQKGLASMAEGGTLFLDEIDALSPGAQAKLLRFMQEHSYRPLGAERFVKADLNVIAATNRDIEQCVSEKRFRSDLYFRLNALRVDLPPLVRRQSDIELLARHCLRLHSSSSGSVRKSFSPAALRKLESYDWPGNVRELFNVVQRAALFSEGQCILLTDVSLPVPDPGEEVAADFRHARARAISAFEKHYVQDLLRKHDGNVTQAALEAKKDRRAFGRLKKKYGINM